MEEQELEVKWKLEMELEIEMENAENKLYYIIWPTDYHRNLV